MMPPASNASRPECLFGDITERIPEHAKDALTRLRKSELARLGISGEVDASKKRKLQAELKHDVLEAGREFMTQAIDLLSRSLMDKKCVRAHCYKPGKQCKAVQGVRDEASGDLALNVSGFSCVDWSTMGVGLGWLGDSALPFAQWAAERLRSAWLNLEDVVICECTPNFDAAHFQALMGCDFHMQVLYVSPNMLGEPVSRNRVYMLLLNKRTRVWSEEVESTSAQEVYDETFFAQVVMPLLEKFRAPQHEVDDQVRRLTVKQNLPNATSSGRKWSFLQVCSAATKASIQEHEAFVDDQIEALGLIQPGEISAEKRRWITNLSQRVQHMPPVRDCVPALLRHSTLYVFGRKRQAVPAEHLEIQGWNLFGSLQEAAEPNDNAQSLEHSLRNLAPGKLRALSGNGMHLHVLGSLILFVLSHTRASAAHPASGLESAGVEI